MCARLGAIEVLGDQLKVLLENALSYPMTEPQRCSVKLFKSLAMALSGLK